MTALPVERCARIAEFEVAGVELLLLQMSPQLEEMERLASTIIAPGQNVRVA